MLNDRCFDICFPDARLANKMDGKSQTCLANCVNSECSCLHGQASLTVLNFRNDRHTGNYGPAPIEAAR